MMRFVIITELLLTADNFKKVIEKTFLKKVDNETST